MKESLYNKLEQYSENGRLAFHMPGHKRKGFENCHPLAAAASIDITEIDGFDDLHRPDGIILETEKKAEELYRSKKCFLSTNGSTGGILAAIRTANIMGKRQGKNKIALARNCHKSVYNGVELCDAIPCYVMPCIIDDIGAYGSISPMAVKELFDKNDGISALVITSPTYEGVVSDIKEISEIVHKNGALLIVDEAHGAHIPFFCHKEIQSGITLGADIVIHSLHKTLSSLTQASAVHVGKDSKTDITLLARQMSIFNTSSPSYPIMASIDHCLDSIDAACFSYWYENMKKTYKELECLKKLKLFEKKTNVFATDISKIVISTIGTSIDGYKLSEILRTDYNIECESANRNYIIAMTGQGTTRYELERLVFALCEIDDYIKSISEKYVKTFPSFAPKIALSPNKAVSAEKKLCRYNHAEGMISGEYLWLYPPGIPFLVPGEVIRKETVDILENYMDQVVSDRCHSGFDGFLTIIDGSCS